MTGQDRVCLVSVPAPRNRARTLAKPGSATAEIDFVHQIRTRRPTRYGSRAQSDRPRQPGGGVARRPGGPAARWPGRPGGPAAATGDGLAEWFSWYGVGPGAPTDTTGRPDIPSSCAFSARTPGEKAQLEGISLQIAPSPAAVRPRPGPFDWISPQMARSPVIFRRAKGADLGGYRMKCAGWEWRGVSCRTPRGLRGRWRLSGWSGRVGPGLWRRRRGGGPGVGARRCRRRGV